MQVKEFGKRTLKAICVTVGTFVFVVLYVFAMIELGHYSPDALLILLFGTSIIGFVYFVKCIAITLVKKTKYRDTLYNREIRLVKKQFDEL